MIPAISTRLRGDEDFTWRRRWINRHTTPSELYYAFDIFDPTKGWLSKPNLTNLPVFHNKVLNTNSKGLRGNRDYAYGKNPNASRVIILGDSFTFGDEVSDDETYPYYLQTMMPTVEVINLGVHGYGHDQMLILLKEEGVKYSPDIVLLGFIAGDMSRNMLQFRDYAKPRFVLHNGNLTLTNVPVPRPEDIRKWDWARPRLCDLSALLIYNVRRRSGLYKKEMEAVSRRLLDDIVTTTESIGAIPLFVFLPTSGELTDQNALTEGEQFLFAYCEERNTVHCMSSRRHFVEKIRQGVTFKSGHWDALGHLTAAEAIHQYIVGHSMAASRGPNR